MIIRVLHVGLGPMGAGVVRQVAGRKGLAIVGAVDLDPAKAGRDLGEVCGLSRKLRSALQIQVMDDITKAIKTTKPDVAVLCTATSLKNVWPQFELVLKQKVPIVSTAQELVYPAKANAGVAKKIDALARRARVAVLGTGVNPGFAMDALPIALTSLCGKVDAVDITRAETAIRTEPHVGLVESITMIADALGWKLDRVTDEVDADVEMPASDDGALAVGQTQRGVGYVKGKPRIKLTLVSGVSAYDEVRITGTPSLTSRIEGGIDAVATAPAIVANAIPNVLTAQPGLRTMRDMVLPSFFGG